MRVFRQQEPDFGNDAVTFALGAIGGLAIGMLLSRRAPAPPRVARLGTELRDRVRSAGDHARNAAQRVRPARLRRLAGEAAALGALEDRVLDTFLADPVLSERGIDVGAISTGILELSGSVWTEAEAETAVRLANSVPGVRTVVNRMELESEGRSSGVTERYEEDDEGNERLGDSRWSGRVIGMNRRRQGRETDPARPDDSQHQENEALRDADRAQWQDEGIAAQRPLTDARTEVQDPWRTRYDEDELDNQDPHGKHAPNTLDEQPQELNAAGRVQDADKK